MDIPAGSREGDGIVIEDDDNMVSRPTPHSVLCPVQLNPPTSIPKSPSKGLPIHCSPPGPQDSSFSIFPAQSTTSSLKKTTPVGSAGDRKDISFPQRGIDLSKEDSKTIPSQPLTTISANHDNTMLPPLNNRLMETLSEWIEGSVKLKPNKSIELEDGDFIRIKSIHKDKETTEVFLRGWRFRRVSDMNGILKKNANELCLVIDLAEDDKLIDNQQFRTGDGVETCRQGLEDVSLSEYKKVRKLILTNLQFPERSFRVSNDVRLPGDRVYHEAVLVCRQKYVVFYKRDKFRMPGAWSEKAAVWLNSSEADPNSCRSDEESRYAWRGVTMRGGSRKGFLDGELAFDRAERRLTGVDMNQSQDKWSIGNIPMLTPGSAASPGGLVASSSRLGSGTRASSPISLDSVSPTVQKRQRRAGVLAKVEVLHQISNNTQAKVSVETVSIPESEDDVEEIPSPNSISKRIQSESSAGQPTKRHCAMRSVSPELYGVHVVNRSKLGTLETEVNCSFTPATVISALKHTHAPITPPSTPVSMLSRRRKRTLREDDDVVELPAELLISDTRSIPTRRRLFKAPTAFQSPDPFAPNHTKLDPSRTPAFRESENQTWKATEAGMLYPAAHGSAKLSKNNLATPATSRPSSPSGARSPFTCRQNQTQRYTFGDAFCGAGGTSRGAKMAGLRVEWGFDFGVNPIASYQSNFFGAHAYHSSADLFTQLQDEDHKVDILHLSPPCQPFSAAHTVAGKDDESNEASFLGIAAIIKKAKPRVVTLEQTSGLLERRDLWFSAMIHMIVDLGFSVRWKLLSMADYGLPQARKRLILLASCPGESLPPYPKPTHTPETAVTVNQVLNSIPDNFSNHNSAIPRAFPPWDGDTPLKYTITCSGGVGNYHPSGKRDFTLREFACLQGFPLEHKFAGNAVKRQIGNAVPPCAVKAFYDEIIKHLKKVDGVE
ncbi:hypothetical protein FGG08_005187 [Glutinoglossum americanum]|uniref:DNA (cytosine-5-)-methyltransferase n=1 Tax=Glutinoglossum americanum TaxID=1670608 RepID=A0A9P8HV04_9PEZI|nr:hypothetical protein FGG08_005187 [Glutinoglossum americanum]